MGRRDYAILLLLSRLGLRACEIASLQLQDIDWQGGTLTIHGKGRRVDRLPLPPDVGEAIAAYLQRGRPQCVYRHVFLCARPPIHGLIPNSIGTLTRRVLKRAGISNSPSKGTHQFRYGLASMLLKKGVSVTAISQVLRHRSPRTTMMYTKIDLDSLRMLSMPWPGGAR
jgi:integrase